MCARTWGWTCSYCKVLKSSSINLYSWCHIILSDSTARLIIWSCLIPISEKVWYSSNITSPTLIRASCASWVWNSLRDICRTSNSYTSVRECIKNLSMIMISIYCISKWTKMYFKLTHNYHESVLHNYQECCKIQVH